MICTVPRSGSTLLCKMLAATKMAGQPDSHFHTLSFVRWLATYDLHASDFPTLQDAIRGVMDAAIERGMGGSNIFGLRMQRGSFDYFMQQLSQICEHQTSDRERIEATFGQTLFVHLTRSDRLGQAISRVRAE